MKITNNTPFSVQAFPSYGPGDKPTLTVIVKGTFDINPEHPAVTSQEQLPVEFGDQLFDPDNGGSIKFESDLVPFKPRADILLIGRAYSPGGQPTETVDVCLSVGEITKRLRVIGDRHWTCMGKMLPVVMSHPEPFTTMDLVYEKSYGGIDMQGGDFCRENLVGRGFVTKKSRDNLDSKPLPNIEDPQCLIRSWDDRPKPAGFGVIGKSWEPRKNMIGTYDSKWQTERAPRPPSDFKFDFYNAAHPDLQVNGYFRGDETVDLLNLTPDGMLSFKLPGLMIGCTVLKSDELMNLDISGPATAIPELNIEAATFNETVAMNPDTLCLLPDENRFYMVWRGICPLFNPAALEVKDIFINFLN